MAAPRDWLVELGLSGKDPDGDLATARDAWEAGELATATEAATLAIGTLAVAPDAGRGRAVVIGGGVLVGLLLVLVVVLLLVRRRTRRRARVLQQAATAPTASVGDDIPGAGGAGA